MCVCVCVCVYWNHNFHTYIYIISLYIYVEFICIFIVKFCKSRLFSSFSESSVKHLAAHPWLQTTNFTSQVTNGPQLIVKKTLNKNLMAHEFGSHVGLCTDSAKLAWDSLSLSLPLSLCFSPAQAVSVSLKNK